MRAPVFALLTVLLAVTAAPQSMEPTLLATDSVGRPTQMQLTRLEIEARIVGVLAETRMTMTFHNPDGSVHQGDLSFPLPEGATVSGYALDIGGVMVDGVVVEKERGRVVFEEIVRRGTDPGLVEWAGGNVFRTRVFPLPARGDRRIMVRFVSELEGGRSSSTYRLPLRFKTPIPTAKVRTVVEQTDGKSEVRSSGAAGLGLSWRGGHVSESELVNARLDSDLVLEIPNRPGRSAVVERAGGELYFCVTSMPALPEPVRPSDPPRRLTLLWDASSSRGAADHEAELGVLDAYFAQLRDSALDVRLVVYDVEVREARHFMVRSGHWRELREALAGVVYDGGTSLDALVKGANDEPADLIILSSDGQASFLDAGTRRLGAPLYALAAAKDAGSGLLHRLADGSSGAVLTLGGETPEALARRIGAGQAVLAALEVTDGEVADVMPAVPAGVRGRVVVTGRLLTPRARLMLRYQVQARTVRSESFLLDASRAIEGTLVRTCWAQSRIADLAVLGKHNAADLVVFGKRYGLVTPGTSLIVLDSVDQYVRYDIEPPASMSEWLSAYRSETERRKGAKQAAEQTRLESVLALWQARTGWWATDYSRATAVPSAQAARRAAPAPTPTAPAVSQPSVQRGAGGRPSPPPTRPPTVHDGIVGRVTDGREPLPGVSVTASGPTLQGTRSAITGVDGSYVLPFLPPGNYSLKFELQGFQTIDASGVLVVAGRVTSIDGLMPLTVVAEELTVTGAYETVSTSSQAATTFETEEVEGVIGGATARSLAVESEAAIVLAPWNPAAAYLDALRAAPTADTLAVYLEQKKQHGRSSGFYLDCADFFRERGDRATALRVLSNIVELDVDDPALLRILGQRLAQLDELERATTALEQVARLRPTEPQSNRDLALLLARRGQYARATELLTRVVLGDWEARFSGIEVVALEELNALRAKARMAGVPAGELDPRLEKLLDVDLRVVLTWDAEGTDMDLHVIEPSGEEVYYQANRSSVGGLLSNDFTQGLGPEEYLIRKARPGSYKVRVNYFGWNGAAPFGPVTLQVEIITDFGRPTEHRRATTLRLDKARDTIDVGEVSF